MNISTEGLVFLAIGIWCLYGYYSMFTGGWAAKMFEEIAQTSVILAIIFGFLDLIITIACLWIGITSLLQ